MIDSPTETTFNRQKNISHSTRKIWALEPEEILFIRQAKLTQLSANVFHWLSRRVHKNSVEVSRFAD